MSSELKNGNKIEKENNISRQNPRNINYENSANVIKRHEYCLRSLVFSVKYLQEIESQLFMI
jgi:hypothetical protein